MLRVSSEDFKENKTPMGGCNCKRQKTKMTNNFELLPSKILVDNLRPTLKDISAEKNKLFCQCSRSKSTSGEENGLTAGMDNKRRSGSTSTISNHNIVFHQNIVINGPVQIINPQPRVMKREQTRNQEKQPKSAKSVATNTRTLAKDISSEKPGKSIFTSTRINLGFENMDVIKKIYVDKYVKSTNSHSSTQRDDGVKSISRGAFKTQEKDAGSASAVDHSSTTVVGQNSKKLSGSSQSDTTEINEFGTGKTYVKQENCTFPQIKKNMTYNLGKTETVSFSSQTLNGDYKPEEKPYFFPVASSGLDLPNASALSATNSSGSKISLFSEPELRPGFLAVDIFTPILPNYYTATNIFLSKKPDSAREPKIKRRSSINDSRHSGNLPYVGDIYNEEYLHDVFAYVLVLEKNLVLKNGFLQSFNPNYKCRSGIANWLLKTQAYLKFSEGEHYLAIYMLDRVLSQIYVPINMYQLLMMSTLWIATKVIGSNNLKASTLINFSDGSYLIQQLLQMELKVLRMMKFHIPTIEPSICVYYFLKLLHLETNDVAKLSAFYIIDCFSLLSEFSSTRPSILAAAAINFIINTYNRQNRDELHFALKHIFTSPIELKQIKTIESQIYTQLVNMLDENYLFNEPYKKYGGKVNIVSSPKLE